MRSCPAGSVPPYDSDEAEPHVAARPRSTKIAQDAPQDRSTEGSKAVVVETTMSNMSLITA